MRKAILILAAIFISVGSSANAYSQLRIAVLPFVNLDGRLDLNVWSYNLQDSLAKEFMKGDPEEFNYRIVPNDSIEIKLAEFNVDPNSPEYKSDMWRAIDALNVDRVVMGEFLFEDNRFIINASLMVVEYRMPDPRHQVRNIFKSEKTIYEAVSVISKKLRQGVLGN